MCGIGWTYVGYFDGIFFQVFHIFKHTDEHQNSTVLYISAVDHLIWLPGEQSNIIPSSRMGYSKQGVYSIHVQAEKNT